MAAGHSDQASKLVLILRHCLMDSNGQLRNSKSWRKGRNKIGVPAGNTDFQQSCSIAFHEHPLSLFDAASASGMTVWSEGEWSKSNMSSSVFAYWSRAVRWGYGRTPFALKKRF